MAAAKIAEQIELLDKTLHKHAPKLCPLVTPRQFERYQDPMSLCMTSEQRKTLAQFLKKQTLHEQNKKSSATPLRLVFISKFDIKSRVFRILSAQYMSEQEALLRCPENFLEAQINSPEKVHAATLLFLKRNSHLKGNSAICHECINVAYAIKVLASNLCGIKGAVLKHSLPLGAGVDPVQVVKDLVTAGQSRTGTQQGGKKAYRVHYG